MSRSSKIKSIGPPSIGLEVRFRVGASPLLPRPLGSDTRVQAKNQVFSLVSRRFIPLRHFDSSLLHIQCDLSSPPTTMADTCKSPDGYLFGITKGRTILLTLILGCLPLTVVLLAPKLFFWLGNSAGYYLRKKTAGRKAQILELTKTEEAEWEKNGKGQRKGKGKERRDSDEWREC